MGGKGFYDTITAAVNDLSEHGYDSAGRVAHWMEQIRQAAQRTMTAPSVMEQMLRKAMIDVYERLIGRGEILKLHAGVARFTLERVKPHLRAELDRRIMASASLIRLNRAAAIEKTLQRFQGWSTSIPAGGAAPGQKVDAKTSMRKALAQLPFEERRVLIDQGHKLRASLSEILAIDGNALAGRWRSHWRQAGYDYRPDHKERDGEVYLLRDTWAAKAGLVKRGAAGYYDQVTSAGEEPFCRCFVEWIYNLRDMPDDMLTAKGAAELARVRAEIATRKSA